MRGKPNGTLPETNSEFTPENQWLEFGMAYFQGPTVSYFQGEYPEKSQRLIFCYCWNSKWRKKLFREGFKNQPLFTVRNEDELVVEPTRLKHVWTSNRINSPGFGVKIKKYLKPPPSIVHQEQNPKSKLQRFPMYIPAVENWAEQQSAKNKWSSYALEDLTYSL